MSSHRLVPSRVALATACVVVLASPPADAAPAVSESCRSILTRLLEASERLGFSIDADTSGIIGSRGDGDLRVACSKDQVAIDLIDDRASVTVTYSRDDSVFGVEISADFPELGSVQHTWILDATGDVLVGSLTFAADTAEMAAFVQFDLEGNVVAADGDALFLNEQLAPLLADSMAWSDAHALVLALADMPTMDIALSVAVPSPRWWGIKKSIIGQAFTCGSATITCTVAATGFLPAAGGCVHAAGACALSVACSLVSCLD